MMTFTYIEDPGHAWLQVPYSLLERLNIDNKITQYSYRNRYFAWLEEDCDAPLLIDVLRANEEEFTIEEHYVKDRDVYFAQQGGVFHFCNCI